jgi:hypothetical protein
MLEQAARYRELAKRARRLTEHVEKEADRMHLLIQADQLEEMADLLERHAGGKAPSITQEVGLEWPMLEQDPVRRQ